MGRQEAIDEAVRRVIKPGGIIYINNLTAEAWYKAVAEKVREEFRKIVQSQSL